MLTQDERDNLELRIQFCDLMEFCTSGRRYCPDNPYSIPEIQAALKCWARLTGRKDWLGLVPREDAAKLNQTLRQDLDEIQADLGLAATGGRVDCSQPNLPATGGVVPHHDAGRIGENPVRGLMLSLFPIRVEGGGQ